MQLDIESLSPTSKRLTITVPAARVDSEFNTAYQELARRVTLPGFRAGRVPMKHLRKRYAGQAHATVAERLIGKSWQFALDENDLVPVAAPEVDASLVKAGAAFPVIFTVEVTPDFEMLPMDSINIDRDIWSVPDEVLDHELVHLAEHFAEWVEVEGRTVAADGDKIFFDYEGRLDGELFDGGAANGAELELGSGQFIPGFEGQVVGKEVGETFTVAVTFPEPYGAEHLAGKAVEFTCTVHSLKAKHPVEIGPELAEKLAEPDMDAVRNTVRDRIEKRHADKSEGEAKDSLRAQLAEQYAFDVPPTLLKIAMDDKRREFVGEAMKGGGSMTEADASFDLEAERLNAEAVIETRTSLVLDSIGRKEGLEVSDQEVAGFVYRMTQAMGPYGERLAQAYQDANNRAGLKRRLRHDKVLDFILPQANVTKIPREVPLPTCEHHSAAGDEGSAE